MTLQPHQQRVVDERNELGAKLERLTAFIKTPTYGGLDLAEQFRLVRQRDVMRAYCNILDERISPIFGGEQPTPASRVLVPVEVRELYDFMCAAFTPMTAQQREIDISLERAKAAMAAPAAVVELEPNYSEMSREALERHAARMAQMLADDKPRKFWEKYASGPMSAPSCLCCGQIPVVVAIKHAELPGIVVCQRCRDAAAAPTTQPTPAAQADAASFKDAIITGTGITKDGIRFDPWSIYPNDNLLSIVRKIRACEGEAAALLVFETALKQHEPQPAPAVPTARVDAADSDTLLDLLADIDKHMRAEWDAGRLPASCWPTEFTQRIDAARAQQRGGA